MSDENEDYQLAANEMASEEQIIKHRKDLLKMLKRSLFVWKAMSDFYDLFEDDKIMEMSAGECVEIFFMKYTQSLIGPNLGAAYMVINEMREFLKKVR